MLETVNTEQKCIVTVGPLIFAAFNNSNRENNNFLELVLKFQKGF